MAPTVRDRAHAAGVAAGALARGWDSPHRSDLCAGPGREPLVDMMAGVEDFEEARAAYEPLLAEGWDHTPHRRGIAHHFSKPGFGLHLTEPSSDLWNERLAFRHALRADPRLVAEYAALKLRLAEEHLDDLTAYTAGKREFVGRVLASAGLSFGRR